ncbi:hypothetical protein QBC47DRAFT_401566 [Echria macrotheca]|uniref:Tat pathway signal sequence n=1 Tax=Echria macrotheca TaxID=438768 RepID=A0AAJ0F688_9PEZI|nr:hypothetical protein QBC47DRAFT_401566 [Echria macrotheca]
MAGPKDTTDFEYHSLQGQTRRAFLSRERYEKLKKPLFVVSLSLNLLLLGGGFAYWFCNRTLGSYERGFAFDLGPVMPEIEVIRQDFTGGVELDDSGNFFTDPRSKQYVGAPSPEVDYAWDYLLSGLNIDLDQSEANMEGRTFRWPESGLYFTGLENRLRQALYPDYYQDVFHDPNDPTRQDHIGHCINHIRQAIQCHADLTPMEWKLVGNRVILDTSTPHTCRNFEKIHRWASERSTDFDGIEMVKNGTLFIVD